MTSRIPIEQSRVTVDPDGTVSFVDGRHRFATLRDLGIRYLPVSVSKEGAEALFGWRASE